MDNRLTLAQELRAFTSDFGESFVRNKHCNEFRSSLGPPPERRGTISCVMSSSLQNTRMRNLSGGSSGSTESGSSSGSSTQLDSQLHFLMDLALSSTTSSLTSSGSSVCRSQPQSSNRKQDRSWSDEDKNASPRSVNASRYKTELCRPFEESGSCKYGDKCQFAHGYHELRNLSRHPKYKTELCRTFHTTGFCPYGPRCHFIHEDETKTGHTSPKLAPSSGSSSPSLSPSSSQDSPIFSYHTSSSRAAARLDNNRALTSKSDNNCYNLETLDQCLSGLGLDNIDNWNTFSCSNNNNKSGPEKDIFSEITMFNPEDLLLDNAPRRQSCRSSPLDNLPCSDIGSQGWSSPCDYFPRVYPDSPSSSPTGSRGSRSQHVSSPDHFTTNNLTNWRSLAMGQY